MTLISWIASSEGVVTSVKLLKTLTLEAPSSSQLTALRRAPLMEMLRLPWSQKQASSRRSLDTPGTSVTSWTNVRVRSGSSRTAVG